MGLPLCDKIKFSGRKIMRKTKIVCTIGPACSDEATLEKMCLAGMNVARLNFSHGTHEDHKKRIDMIKSVRARLGMPIGILLDTKGPEYRTGIFKNDRVDVAKDSVFTFTPDDILGDETRVSVSYKSLADDLYVGDTILVNNGLMVFEVEEIRGRDVVCRALNSGFLSNRKSMSFPNKVLRNDYLSEQDKADILFGVENDVDFIACSFVSRVEDLQDVQAFLDQHNASDMSLIAKIENRSGIDNIESICTACDGILIGRGDMGVEMPYEELPSIQKKLITKCRMLGKRVITATEMLESMITNPRPTRAEISDVANAVYDGSSAVMLSGETAAGQYPVESVMAMARITEHTEQNIHYKKRFRNADFHIRNTIDATSHAICGLAIDIDAKAIVACSLSGMTTRMISRFRSPVDILGVTVSNKSLNKLSLSWGVKPVLCEMCPTIEDLFAEAKRIATSALGLKEGDKIIITGGKTDGSSGNTDLIKIETI